MGEITISTKEYKELVEASVRISVFADFVRTSKYRIDKEECASFLGFLLEDEKDQDEDEDGTY